MMTSREEMEHGARGSENSNTLGYELNSAGHIHAFTISPTEDRHSRTLGYTFRLYLSQSVFTVLVVTAFSLWGTGAK